jgi:hypothetical protein
MMNKQQNGIKSMREPWKIGDYRLFGDILPFIGYETMEASVKDLTTSQDVDPSQDKVYGDFFTMEWFGYGVSLGGFRVRLK